MAIIFAQDIIEVAVRANYALQPVVNVLHFFNDEQAKNDAAMVRDVADNWQDHVLDVLAANYELVDFTWRSLDPDDNNTGVVQPDPLKPTVGGVATAAMTPNVAYLIHKNTENRPRGRRDGRMYLAGVPEDAAGAAGEVDPAFVTSVDTAMLAFWNGIDDNVVGTSAGSGMAVLETTPESRVPGTLPVTLGWRRVTSLTCDTVLATQRERLR